MILDFIVFSVVRTTDSEEKNNLSIIQRFGQRKTVGGL